MVPPMKRSQRSSAYPSAQVRNHVTRLYRKIGVNRRSAVVVWARGARAWRHQTG